jgi:hypothetical protein
MKPEIRSTKSETRNKLKNPKTTMFQARSIDPGVLDFSILRFIGFPFVSDFEIRNSNFSMIMRMAARRFFEVLVLNFYNINMW